MKCHDINGNPCTLDTLCRKEPEWAASRIAALSDRVDKMNHEKDHLRARLAEKLNIIECLQRHQSENLTCKTCKHWRPDSEVPYDSGTCEQIETDDSKFKIVDEPSSYGNGNGPVHVETGACFGCVLWEAMED